MKASAPTIVYLRLRNGTAFGKEAIIHEHLHTEHTRIDSCKIALSFDKDPRFVRVDYAAGRFTLVPFANIGAIHCEQAAAAE